MIDVHNPIRLIIADDHEVMRSGLAALLSDIPEIELVAQAKNGREAINLAQRHKPDIILLDISMDDMTGIEAMGRFLPDLPEVKVLMLTMHEDEALFFKSIQAGASGYFLKGSRSEELFNAIEAVHMGGVYLPPPLAGTMVQAVLNRHPAPAAPPPLTPRERQIVLLIVKGLTNSAIARKLTVSINTVKTPRLNIYQKLNLRDRTSLVDYALQHGLLTHSQ
ncbi:MAG TPA: response regulator transcription factor [Chloroflexi bacterium]|nr:response regulator transcription factor [Chloroflexota bacterium]